MNNFNYNAVTNFFDQNSKIPSKEILDNIDQLISDIRNEEPDNRQKLIENVANEILNALPKNPDEFAHFVGRQLVDASDSKKTFYHTLTELINLMLLEKTRSKDSNKGQDSLSPAVKKAFTDLKYLINKSWQNRKTLPYFQDQLKEIQDLTMSNLKIGDLGPLMSVSKAMNKTVKVNLVRRINNGTFLLPAMTFETAKKYLAGYEDQIQRLHLDGKTPNGDELAKAFPNLTHLTYGEQSYEEQFGESSANPNFSFLAHLTKLKHLELYDDGKLEIDDMALGHVSVLKNLESLSLIKCQSLALSDVGLQKLGELVSLKSLTIVDGFYTEVSDKGLSFLAQNTQIENLELTCHKFTGKALKPLKKLKNIKNIKLSNNNIKDEDLVCLRHMPLKNLNLSNCEKITDECLQYLKDNTQLEKLDLSYCYNINGNGFRYLAGMNQLKALNLRCNYFPPYTPVNSLSDEGLSFLVNKISMEELDLRGCHRVTNEGLSHLAGMHHMKTLALSDMENITDEGLSHLAGMHHMKTLALSDMENITDEGLSHLAGMDLLKNFKLSGLKNITNEGLTRMFEKMTHMQILTITGGNIKNCSFLSKTSEIKFLELYLGRSPGNITFEGLKNLEQLDLTHTDLTDKDLESLKELKNLKVVRLSEGTVGNLTQKFVKNLRKTLPNTDFVLE